MAKALLAPEDGAAMSVGEAGAQRREAAAL